jgi:hypothetical protein
VDYFEALVDSTFFLQSTVEYYAKMWGDTTYDTTFVFGEDGSSFVSTVLQSALDGAFWFYVQSVTGVGEGALASLPERNELFANTPNPFNPTTTLPFALSRKGRVTLTLYDARGRRVAVLVDEERPAGFYSVPWNGATGTGADAPSGVYFARIQSGDWTESRKIILIR